MSQKFRNMPGSRQLKAQMTDLRKNYLTGQKLGVFKVKLDGVNNSLNQEEIFEENNDTEEN